MLSPSALRYVAVLGLLLCLTAGLAIAFGYISVDSWYYMLLAQSIRDGHPLHLHGDYSAVYPLGYPSLLALTAPIARPEVMMITAKLVNVALLAADFVLIWRASRHLLMATLIVINPITLVIAMYSWSENLELFAICATIALVARLSRGPDIKALILLAGALIIGVFARYFFAPFAFLIFITILLAYGRTVAFRVFPAFCAAALVYLAYQGINWAITGYPTGMPRNPAPEAPLLLIREFMVACGWNGLKVVLAGGLLLLIARWRRWREDEPDTAGRSVAAMILMMGLAFLALAFLLRFRTFFDPYNTRTLGYGIVLTFAGLVGRSIHPEANKSAWPLGALLACGLFSVVFADDFAIPQDIHDLITDPEDYSFPAASLGALRGHLPEDVEHADLIVSFRLPVTNLDSTNVDNIPEVYYGPNMDIMAPLGGPDNPPEHVPAFMARIADMDPDSCFVDFTPYAKVADFDTYLNAQALIDRRWSFRDFRYHKVKVNVLAPDMRAWLRRAFVPGRYVPCVQAFGPWPKSSD